MKQPLFLIDAYNIIRNNPSLALFEEESGTPATIQRFTAMCWEAMVEGEQWVVAFDGHGEPETRTDKPGCRLEIHFSGDLKADDILLDQARFALTEGRKVILATSDFEVYEEGVEKMNAYEFYDLLVSRPLLEQEHEQPAATPPSSFSIKPMQVLSPLQESGHVPWGAEKEKGLLLEIQQILEYYGESIAKKANKAATRIEKALRKETTLTPDPDPEKVVQRAIKELLRKLA
jgi:predicted RNA-binding protein with PIN domain